MSDVWQCRSSAVCTIMKLRYTSIFKGNAKIRALIQKHSSYLRKLPFKNCHSPKVQAKRLDILSQAKATLQARFSSVFTPRYVALTRPPPEKKVWYHACVASHALSASILAAKGTLSTSSFEARIVTQASVRKRTSDWGTRR